MDKKLRVFATLTALIALAAGSLAAQRSDGGRAGGSTLTASDFTYLGSYRIPTPSVGALNGTGGMGLALRYEPSDLTNPVHLLTTAYRPTEVQTGTHRIKLEMRGTSIKLWVDEGSGYGANPVAAATDSDIASAGKSGLFVGGAIGYALDHFTATNAGGSALATDNFTASNGTALAGRTLSGGGTWARHASYTTSSLEIQGNAARFVSGDTDNTVYYASGSAANADYDVEADLSYIATTGATGIAGRVDTAANTMYVAYYFTNGTTNCWALAKFVAGTYTELGRGVSPKGGTGYMAHLIEWRDATPTNPASPTLSSSYGTATMMREWGNLFGPGPSKRTTYNNAVLYDLSDGLAGTQREGGLGWDSVNNHLYWTFAETYSNDDNAALLGYAELNYATGAITPHGPWLTSATKRKGGTAGVVELPPAFVSAAGLGMQRLATVGSRPASLNASGDASAGPALTSFVPPVGVTEQMSIASTRLVGYAPTSSVSGPLRPASIQWFQGAGSRAMIPYSAFPENTWNIYDGTYGGAFIYGATKSGYVTVQRLWKGQATYVHAHNTAEMIVNALSIVSEADLVEVALGHAKPQSLQPVTAELTWPVLDPADYASIRMCTIASVTSTAGQRRSGQDASGSRDLNAVVTTTAPHGLPASGAISIQGVSQAVYNDNWEFTTTGPTTFEIHNASLDSYTWTGVSGTGGECRTTDNGNEDYNGVRIFGLAKDDNTHKLYLGYRHKDGTPMVAVWSYPD